MKNRIEKNINEIPLYRIIDIRKYEKDWIKVDLGYLQNAQQVLPRLLTVFYGFL